LQRLGVSDLIGEALLDQEIPLRPSQRLSEGMSVGSVVSNTSPLVRLTTADLLDVLRQIYG
jgi:hypothetical protein